MLAPAENDRLKELRRFRAPGEQMVYLCAVGVSFGLLMIVGVLWIIFVNGVRSFWLQPVAKIELRQEADFEFRGGKVMGGTIVEQRQRKTRLVREEGEQPEDVVEWKIFVGNKDIFGPAFKYIDEDAIARVTWPKDIMMMERMEYGNAIGYPAKLTLPDGREIAADSPDFEEKFQRLVEQVNDRREEIKEIEGSIIGKINAKMRDLEIRKRGLMREGVDAEDERMQKIDEQRAKLQERYQEWADEASELREKQEQALITYRTITGDEKTLPMGDVVKYWYPNQLGFFDRLGWFFRNFWYFLSHDPREANTEGGIFPAIFGTFVMVLLLSVFVSPFGVLAAIYLREYARQGTFVRAVRIAVNNLAGVPSIVFGAFGLGFFVYFVGGGIDRMFFDDSLPTPTFGTGGILWASLTLALMTVPQVIVATEEALSAVPRSMREGSLACGASKWQTIQRIVLPHAVPGIITGVILSMAHGAGEVAPLMLVGVVKLAPSLPVDNIFPYLHLERKFMHLGFHIYDLGFQSPDSEAARPMVFATTLVLIMVVLLLNIFAIWLRERLRRKYSTGAF